jgi:hypothetical protein
VDVATPQEKQYVFPGLIWEPPHPPQGCSSLRQMLRVATVARLATLISINTKLYDSRIVENLQSA